MPACVAQELGARDIAQDSQRAQQVGEKAKEIFKVRNPPAVFSNALHAMPERASASEPQQAFHKMIEKLPDREATVDGSKRRELAVRPRPTTTTAFWPAPG